MITWALITWHWSLGNVTWEWSHGNDHLGTDHTAMITWQWSLGNDHIWAHECNRSPTALRAAPFSASLKAAVRTAPFPLQRLRLTCTTKGLNEPESLQFLHQVSENDTRYKIMWSDFINSKGNWVLVFFITLHLGLAKKEKLAIDNMQILSMRRHALFW